MWLSQRRVKRTVEFLESMGINPSRLNAAGLGEEQLANHCAEDIRCTEEEHLVNRRSEFGIVEY